MTRKVILKSQANQVLEIIKKFGLIPAEFKWFEKTTKLNSTKDVVSSLVHLPTGYYFLFEYDRDGKHWSEYSPGGSVAVVTLKYTASWGVQLGNVIDWAQSLKREVESPNLWDAISQERRILEVVNEPIFYNELFNVEEQKKINANLEEIKQYLLTTTDLSKEQVQLVDKQFDYFKNSLQRIGRKDWLMMFTGFLVSKILTLGLQSDTAKELFRFTSNALSWLIAKADTLHLGG